VGVVCILVGKWQLAFARHVKQIVNSSSAEQRDVYYHVFSQIIQDEFREKFIRTNKCFTNEGMLLKFELHQDRKLELLIHAPDRYVAVYTREIGWTEWKVWSYHDSCWTEGVDMALKAYDKEIFHVKTIPNGWYNCVALKEEELAELTAARKMRYASV
jgi:hypothetical protein